MRKYLLSVIIILSCLKANAQSESDSLVSLAKVNFVEITEFTGWSQFDDTQPEGKIEVVDDVSGLSCGIQSSNSLIVFICPYHNVILLNKSLQILCRSPLVKVGHDGQLLHRYALMFIDEEQENHLAGTYSVLGQVTVKILLRVAIQDRNVYKKIILITH